MHYRVDCYDYVSPEVTIARCYIFSDLEKATQKFIEGMKAGYSEVCFYFFSSDKGDAVQIARHPMRENYHGRSQVTEDAFEGSGRKDCFAHGKAG